jgi:hypothetical protein
LERPGKVRVRQPVCVYIKFRRMSVKDSEQPTIVSGVVCCSDAATIYMQKSIVSKSLLFSGRVNCPKILAAEC